MMKENNMSIKLINQNTKYLNFINYQYGTDLFGNLYLDKIKGNMIQQKAKIEKTWKLKDLGSLVRVLDFEIYKREVQNYENITTQIE